ncbi:MAG: hypothetical protein ACK559_36310, partial [bacterium]
MPQVPLEIARDARNVAQVAVLAVPLREPGKNAQYLGGALGAKYRIGEAEGRSVEGRVPRPERTVMRIKRIGEIKIDIDPRILQHRGKVIG